MTSYDRYALEHAAELIDQAFGLVIAAGAGIGVDSGLPDFRGNNGFWKAYPGLGKAGIEFSEIATPRAFEADPTLAWGFYGHRLAMYRKTEPHEGFGFLQRWGERMPLGAFVFTSNVDGQFQAAGFPDQAVHECHGALNWLQCLRPCCDDIWPATDLAPDVDNEQCRWRGPIPTCRHCGGTARPNVLLFADNGWLDHRARDQETRLSRWLRGVQRPVVIEIGAGSQIPTVRHFSERILVEHNGRLIRINPREFIVPTPSDVGLCANARTAIQAIDAVLQDGRL